MTKQRRASNFSVLFLVLVIFLCLSWIWQMNSSAPQLDYAQVRQLFQQEKVEELTVSEGHVLTLKLKDSTDKVRYQLYSFDLFYEDLDPLIQEQYAKGIIKHYDYPPKESTNWLEVLLPWILMAGVVVLLWYLMAARAQGGMGPDRMAKFGAARTRGLSDKDKKVTFDDVAGADEEKEEPRDTV